MVTYVAILPRLPSYLGAVLTWRRWKTPAIMLVVLLLCAATAGVAAPAASDSGKGGDNLTSTLGERYATVAREAELTPEETEQLAQLVAPWNAQEQRFNREYGDLHKEYVANRRAGHSYAMVRTIAKRESMLARQREETRKQDVAVRRLLTEQQRTNLAAYALTALTIRSLGDMSLTDKQKAEVRRLAAEPAKDLRRLLPRETAANRTVFHSFRKQVMMKVLTDDQRAALCKNPPTAEEKLPGPEDRWWWYEPVAADK